MSIVAVIAVVALLATAITLAALVALHVLPTGLSPVRDPVSAYGISRFAVLYRVQTVGTAVAAGALAIGLLLSDIDSALPAVIALAALAATRAVVSWVPMDAEGTPATGRGRAHNLLAFGAFAAASVGGFMLGIAASATPAIAWAATPATALGWLMSAASALTLVSGAVHALRPVFGLAERVIYVGMIAWLTLTAFCLLA